MTEKRFVDYFDKDDNYIIQDLQNEDEYQVGFVNCDEDVFLELINQLSDENEQLKEQLSEAKADEKQLGISFMGYKMKLIEVLQKRYDKVKGKTLYADVYTEIAEEMGVELE